MLFGTCGILLLSTGVYQTIHTSEAAGVIVEEVLTSETRTREFRTTLEQAFLFLQASPSASDSRKTSSIGGHQADSIDYGLAMVADSSLVASSPVLSTAPAFGSVGSGREVFDYTVREGDTLSTLAEEFGISMETLASTNGLSARTSLKVGGTLTILPVDGARHTVRSGETISSIAKRYEVSEDEIVSFNDLSGESVLTVGASLVVPGGKAVALAGPARTGASSASGQTRYSLVDLGGYFLFPTRGKITQELHAYNAVDIGGSAFCNTPVYAAADGTVLTTAIGGWNGGAGKYVKISHSNGTGTFYAHLSQVLVTPGAAVSKGDVIGLMGSTGRSTGCHVHFEVRGAKNPFAG